jgi:hypothetical protein
MKMLIMIALLLVSVPSFASFNEVECRGYSGSKNVYLEIEQSFPTNNVFKRMLLSLHSNGTQENFQYTVTSRRYNGFNNITYHDVGLRLEVDLWPDANPRWGRYYRAILQSSALGNGIANLECQFPNAN